MGCAEVLVDPFQRFRECQTLIADACRRVGRVSASVEIVAVSKQQPVPLVTQFCAACAQAGFAPTLGENYVQEYAKKQGEIRASSGSQQPRVHLLGPLQSNKVRKAVALFDVLESVHRADIVAAIAAEGERLGRVVPIFLQVNISRDPKKSGFAVEEVLPMVKHVIEFLPAVSLQGLMAITQWHEEPEGARNDFRRMAELRQELVDWGFGENFAGGRCRLSMGMSDDFQVAVEEGADLVRIGSRIFGVRSR